MKPDEKTNRTVDAIILIHRGDSPYLIHTLCQVRRFNPKAKVILIGDYSNSGHHGIDHYLISDYNKSASEFTASYTHLSPNRLEFELFCFNRWFILSEFIKAHQLVHCLYIDSDVLLYADFSELAKKFANYGLTLSCQTAPHCMFVNRVEVIADFCRYLETHYRQPEKLYALQELYREMNLINSFDGICDMTLLNRFTKEERYDIGDTYQVIGGTIIDHNFNVADPFVEESGHKGIIWENGLPYGRHASSGELIRFSAIHFQGAAKRLIPQYQTGSSWEVLRAKILRKFFWIKQSAISFSRSILPILNRQ